MGSCKGGCKIRACPCEKLGIKYTGSCKYFHGLKFCNCKEIVLFEENKEDEREIEYATGFDSDTRNSVTFHIYIYITLPETLP